MIKLLKRLFGNEKYTLNKSIVSNGYHQLIQELEKEHSIMMQKLENEKIEREIKNEAQRWLDEDNNVQTIKIGEIEFKNYCIHVMRPFISSTTIYDEETAIYGRSDMDKLVREEYQKLRTSNCC